MSGSPPFKFAKKYGTPTRGLERAISRDVIATRSEIEEEIRRILMDKFSWEWKRVDAPLKVVLARSVRVRRKSEVKVCRDPNDAMFLECAALANADLLVAGDKDLLILGSYEETRILTPAAYLDAD